jgi:hypothetical protein
MRSALIALLCAACRFSPLAGSDAGGPGDSASPGEGGGPDGGELVPTCGRAGAIRDTFDDLDHWKVALDTSSTPTASIESGQVVLTPPSKQINAGIASKHFVDLRDAAVEVDVVQTDTIGDAVTRLSVGQDPMHVITMYVKSGMLHGDIIDMAHAGSTSSATYDPVAQKYWQITESSGQITFEVSPNGTSWTALTAQTFPTPMFASSARISLEVDAPSTGSTFGSATFDDLNQTVPTSPWCDASTAMGWMPPSWMNEPAPMMDFMCMPMIGPATAKLTQGGSGDCYIGSSPAYNLVNSAVSIDIDPLGQGLAYTPYVLVVGDGELQLTGLDDSDDDICMPNLLCNHAYSSTADRYWQLKESSGMLILSTSSDNATWVQVLAPVVDPFDLSAVEIRLGATAEDLNPAAPTVTFDAIN